MEELEPITLKRIQSIPMHQVELPVGICEKGDFYIPFDQLCKTIHANPEMMLEKTKRRAFIATHMKKAAFDFASEKHEAALRADMMALWLTQIDAIDLKEEARQGMQVLQEEAALILLEALISGRLTATEPISTYLNDDSLPVKTYKEALSLLNIAREAIIEHYEKAQMKFRFRHRHLPHDEFDLDE